MRWKLSDTRLTKGRTNMKLYKETLRKLSVVGLPLLAVMFVYTLVMGGTDCFGAYNIVQSTSAISQIPALRYYVFAGALFALYGFSYQFSRAGSDVYHSLPVKRSELYLSTLMAAATWMGATILISELEMLLIYLISGCPFVPVYIPLSILYYFAASMIVYAAAAIGCALSGTIVTALASTGVVLLLPRLVQFLFARGIVERVPIVGWLDFGPLLDPTTNAATGILAMQLRQVFNGQLITLPYILYSLLIAAVMLALGLWLFNKRPSEIAQKNGGHRVWTIVTATLLAFTVMLPVTMNYSKVFSTYGFVLMMAALGVYVIYQMIVSTKIKQALKTLPFFLIAVLGVLAMSGLIQSTADKMLNQTPDASQIESVTFRGFDYRAGETTYTTLLTKDVAFTDEKTREYVAQALKDAVAKLQPDSEYDNYWYNEFSAVEPITIHLVGGGTILRTIEFEDIDALNDLRSGNRDFSQALLDFPPMDSVQYLWIISGFTDEEEQAILESYIAEARDNGLIGSYYYRSRRADLLPNGNYVVQGSEQVLSSIYLAGYIGNQRFSDSYILRLTTPKTASLLMKTCNQFATDDLISGLNEMIKLFEDGKNKKNDNLGFNLNVYNYRDPSGRLTQISQSFYLNQYTKTSGFPYDIKQLEYLRRFAEALADTELTDDPTGLFLSLDWNYYQEAYDGESGEFNHPAAYLRFKDEASEQAFVTLIREWNALQNTF
jgi:ABC-2 type transport system permease protein